MYELVEGPLLSKGPMHAVVSAAGLGYRIETSLRTSEALPARAGAPVRLLLHLEVREDAWRLFGFVDEPERELFRRLLRVSGIGPSHALGLLSTLGPEGCWAALAARDPKLLARTKGIGKRLAERLCTELGEEAERHAGPVPRADGDAAGSGPAASDAAVRPGRLGEVVDALIVLGYAEAEAERAAARAVEAADPETASGDLVRLALRRL